MTNQIQMFEPPEGLRPVWSEGAGASGLSPMDKDVIRLLKTRRDRLGRKVVLIGRRQILRRPSLSSLMMKGCFVAAGRTGRFFRLGEEIADEK